MNKSVVKYGIIGGVIVSLFMIVQFYLFERSSEYEDQEVLGFLSIFLGFIPIYLAIRHVRDRENGGEISFWQGFKIGIWVSLIVSLIYTAVWMIYVQINGNEFMDSYFQKTIDDLQNSGISQEELDLKLAEMRAGIEYYKKPLVQTFVTFTEIFPLGCLVSLLAAMVLKKK